MKSIGKLTKRWLQVRTEWLSLHPPNHEGYYECYIRHEWIPAAEVTLDHIKSRSRFPELRFVLSNLAPCCAKCNQEKGSRSLEEMLQHTESLPPEELPF